MNQRIEIRKTPKLGSMKETLSLVAKVTKESLSYKKKLTGGSLRFVFSAFKARRVAGLGEKCKKANEGLLVSPDITIEGHKYRVLRYGPPFHKVPPPLNLPTGYTVFTHNHDVVNNLEKCKKVCAFYRIWEKFYVDPLVIPRSRTLIRWIADLKKRIFDDITERRQTGYGGMEGSEEERRVLQELDEEVCLFHDADMELLTLEERLGNLQFDLFDHPSETNISEFIELVQRFKELMPKEKDYLERRLDAWQRYAHLLERKYKVHISLDFNMTGLGLAAFIDFMKYVLFQRVIPEAVLGKVAFEVLKSVTEAKVTEYLLNFLVHYGGLTSLKAQAHEHAILEKALDEYIEVWESKIPYGMIRLP